MDLLEKLMNLIFPPVALYALFSFYPTYQRLKSIYSFFHSYLFFQEDLAGKVVLITGAASGIGESLAYEYGKKGAYLALVDIRAEPLYDVAAATELHGSPEVIPIIGDVSRLEDCQRFVHATVHHFGRLDHLVTNAGVAPLYLFEDVDDLTKSSPAIDINFWGSVYCTFYARPYLKKSRGRIVVIASACGWIPSPRLSFYCASKAAVISLYETLRIEFGSDIGITIVAPGVIDSELTRGKFMSKDGELKFNQQLRDVQISILPVESAQNCAKEIIKGVCSGERYVVVPAWVGTVRLWRVFCPEILEWLGRWLLITEPAVSISEAPSKKILDIARTVSRVFMP